jgi:hypothetical protein
MGTSLLSLASPPPGLVGDLSRFSGSQLLRSRSTALLCHTSPRGAGTPARVRRLGYFTNAGSVLAVQLGQDRLGCTR